MFKSITTIALLALSVSAAHAADLVTSPPTDERVNLSSDPGWGFYVQGYGGVVTQNTLNVIDTFNFGEGDNETESFVDQLTHGPAFGFGAGVTTPVDGLSVGFDVFHTSQSVSAFNFEEATPNLTVDSLSIFATVEGAYHLNPTFDLYATGGLGATSYHVHDGNAAEEEGGVADANSVWVPAYEVGVGVRAKVTENIALFTEFKHSDTFTTADLPEVNDGFFSQAISTGHNAVTAGVRLSF